MTSLLTAAFGFLEQVLQSKGAFVAFAFLVIIAEANGIYYFMVFNKNKMVVQKRKELGMEEVHKTIQSTFKIMFSHYLTLAKERLGEGYFNENETLLYRYLLMATFDDQRPAYRARIIRNHFNEKGSDEWSTYVHGCIKEDEETRSIFLDLHYPPKATILRQDVYDWNQSKMPEVHREFEALFSRLLLISQKNKLRKFFGVQVGV